MFYTSVIMYIVHSDSLLHIIPVKMAILWDVKKMFENTHFVCSLYLNYPREKMDWSHGKVLLAVN